MAAIVPVKQIMSQLEDPTMKAEIVKALPVGDKNVDRRLRIVRSVLMSDSKLRQCEPVSIIGAVVECAQLGLEVGLHAALVPYGKTCTLIIQYQGLMELARRSGDVARWYADVVREGDAFEYELGTKQFIRHKPKPNNAGKLLYAYAIAKMTNGEETFRVIDENEANKAKDVGGGEKSFGWRDWPEEMWKKTALRRLCKLLPQCVEMQHAERLEVQAELRQPQTFEHNFAGALGVASTGQSPEQAEALDKRLKAAQRKANKTSQADSDKLRSEKPAEQVPPADDTIPFDEPVKDALPRIGMAMIDSLDDGESFAAAGAIESIDSRQAKGKDVNDIIITDPEDASHKFTLWGSMPAWAGEGISVVIDRAYIKGEYQGSKNVTIDEWGPAE